ncbi:MAG: tetratricopeptide repeat protein, partial [Chloroflexi bacterium]|nr:tetratricopeptide repeat protein [Chloroflexota bacterium]
PNDYQVTITTTWEMAFEDACKTPGAADLLNLCCFLAADDIPLGVLTAHAEKLPPELAAVLTDELARDDALAGLQTFSLLTRTDGALAVHRLVQTVARDRMGEKRRMMWVEAAAELIIATLPDWTRLHEWEDGRQILSHMIAVADLGLELEWETERLAFLCNWIGYYLKFLADYAGARPYYERALSIREKALGPDHPDTATTVNDIGL